MNERSTGLAECSRPEGCAYPLPELDRLSELALFVFRKCVTQWHTGFNGRSGLIYREAHDAADDYQIEWSVPLREKIQVCEIAKLNADAELREREKNEKLPSAPSPRTAPQKYVF